MNELVMMSNIASEEMKNIEDLDRYIKNNSDLEMFLQILDESSEDKS